MARPILKITDGTTIVDLLNMKGWSLDEWKPSVPEPKGGGVFRNSPLTDGRKLVFRKLDNIIDTFNLIGSGHDQNNLIQSIQELERLLEKGLSYWTSEWQNVPVWIEARGSCEDEIRYATIVDYRLTGFGSPYSQPFFNRPDNTASEAILVIEHQLWQETIPGDDGTPMTLDNETDATKQVWVSNFNYTWNNGVEIEHAFYRDDSTGTFSDDFITWDYSSPCPLLPNPVADGDEIYFFSDYHPFGSIFLNIGTAADDFVLDWYYYNDGASWTNCTMDACGDEQLGSTGVQSLIFKFMFDSGPYAYHGANGWCFKAVVRNTGASPITPTQISYPPFTATKAYIDIDAEDVIGDTSSLARIIMSPTPCQYEMGNITMGLRSLSRGTNFSAYWLCNNFSFVSGITYTTTGTHPETTTYPAYEWTQIDGFGDTWEEVAQWSVSNTVAKEYPGIYHAFARVQEDIVAIGDVKIRLKFEGGNFITYSDIGIVTYTDGLGDTSSELSVVDLGQFIIPYSETMLSSETLYGFSITIEAIVPVGTTLYLQDVITIPADEWAANYNAEYKDGANYRTYFKNGYILDLDSIRNPRQYRSAIILTNGNYLGEAVKISSGDPMFQSNSDQRLWFFMYRGDDSPSSYVDWCLGITAERSARYLLMRGDR